MATKQISLQLSIVSTTLLFIIASSVSAISESTASASGEWLYNFSSLFAWFNYHCVMFQVATEAPYYESITPTMTMDSLVSPYGLRISVTQSLTEGPWASPEAIDITKPEAMTTQATTTVQVQVGFQSLYNEHSKDIAAFSLTCNFTSGLANSVIWTRDGFLLHNTGPLVLTDASTHSYTNVLIVSDRTPETYTCTIRGTSDQVLSSANFTVQGMHHVCSYLRLNVEFYFLLSFCSPCGCCSRSVEFLWSSGGQLESSIWWS